MTENAPMDFELILSMSKDSALDEEAHRNRKILINAYEAQLAGEGGALLALLDPEATFQQAASLPYGCVKQGIVDIKDGVARMFSTWRPLRVEILEVAAAGDVVMSYYRFTGTSRSTGETYDALGTEIFRFRSGKIIDWRPFYWDTHAVRDVCGL
jgi:ketosteroid isomerase-like protein